MASSPPAQRWTKAGPIAVSMPADDVQRLQDTQEVTTAVPAPLGLFGFATGFFLLTGVGLIPHTVDANVTLSIELFSFAYISLILGTAAVKLNPVFVAILWTLVPGFTLSGLGLIGEPKIIGHVGGYWLIASAVLAFYAAGALVINSGYRRTVLPLFGKA
jgi:hypothetical protein